MAMAIEDSNVTDALHRPLRDLRISVIDRCNLRCTYCMPSEVFGPDYAFLPREDWLEFDEIERLARAFVDLGVRKLRLTGGEPLLRPRLPDLVTRLSAIPRVEDLAITTNGVRLAAVARELKQADLGRVTVSLDALDAEILGRMNGGRCLPEPILEGIDTALANGLPVKINTVVQRGVNESEILPLARYFHRLQIPIRFIEYMDVGNGRRWERSQVVPSAEILEMLQEEFPLVPLSPRSPGEVAQRYGISGGGWEVGFVSSITAPFCSACNRARISADGKLFTCLFASNGTDLKPLLRGSDQSLTDHLARYWSRRDDRYSEERGDAEMTMEGADQVAMSFVGG